MLPRHALLPLHRIQQHTWLSVVRRTPTAQHPGRGYKRRRAAGPRAAAAAGGGDHSGEEDEATETDEDDDEAKVSPTDRPALQSLTPCTAQHTLARPPPMLAVRLQSPSARTPWRPWAVRRRPRLS